MIPQTQSLIVPRGPIARGLLLAYNAAFPRLDLITKKQAIAGINGDIDQKPGVFGNALYNPGTTAGTSRVFANAYTGGTNYTFAAVVQDNIGRGAIRVAFSSDVSAVARFFHLRFDASNFPQFVCFNTIGGGFTATGAVASSAAGRTVLVGRKSGTEITVWMNGVLAGSTTLSSGTPVTLSTAFSFGLGNLYRDSGSANYFKGDIYGVYMWNRPLPNSEINAFGLNPDIMFPPRSRHRWAPAAAGGASVFNPYFYQHIAGTGV